MMEPVSSSTAKMALAVLRQDDEALTLREKVPYSWHIQRHLEYYVPQMSVHCTTWSHQARGTRFWTPCSVGL